MRPESGQSILLFIVLFSVASGMLGLALDGARVLQEKRQVQGLADAAALGAAFELESAGTEQDLASAALDDARLNGFRDDTDEMTVRRLSSQDAVEVSLRRSVRTTFMALFGTAELAVSARAAAIWSASPAPCLLALAEDGPDALVVDGDGVLRVECSVEVRSADPEAFTLTGDGCLSAERVDARAAPDACISPRPSEPRPSEPRPTRTASPNRPTPSCVGRPAGASTPGEYGVSNYWPGCYAERLRIDEGVSSFAPGEYVLLDGLEILGGEAEGKGVSFLILDGPVEIAGEALVQLKGAPLFDSHDSGGKALLIPADGSELSGELVFPARTLTWRPNASGHSGWNSVTAERIRLLVDDDRRVLQAAPADLRTGAGRPVLIQ